ncbi:sulfurtransferase TusA family protein [Sphingomonas sp. SFZ2018-12]|uniref:sulfurtransferase TusA family protein n=1 Tax=Sphingomonas sp. SFZ2018-12 TaxID=2683197 RepID=UPI001F113283|nr:sulfurtransferase TusA family protein [Sphingomonas sp. SFZ2018-12]MCH4893111.1 sulfurtransferase TusA family protein [Sphingomonas sp. SFZ2018-12]
MTRIDARGLRCPWPAIRLARALRDGAALPIHLIADDPAAAAEVAAAAAHAGLHVEHPDDHVFILTQGR